MDDEDNALLLLCSLPKSFNHFNDIILYGNECTTTLEEVQTPLRTKELTKFKDLKIEESGKGLNVLWQRSEHIEKGKGKSRSKGFNKSKYKYFISHKYGPSKRIVLTKEATIISFKFWFPGWRWLWEWGCTRTHKLEIEKELGIGIRLLLSCVPEKGVFWDFRAKSMWGCSARKQQGLQNSTFMYHSSEVVS